MLILGGILSTADYAQSAVCYIKSTCHISSECSSAETRQEHKNTFHCIPSFYVVLLHLHLYSILYYIFNLVVYWALLQSPHKQLHNNLSAPVLLPKQFYPIQAWTRRLKVGLWYPHQDVSNRSLSLVSCLVGPSWINLFVQHIPQVLDWFEICGIWRPNQHLELIVVLLKSFLNHFYFVAGTLFRWILFPWNGV